MPDIPKYVHCFACGSHEEVVTEEHHNWREDRPPDGWFVVGIRISSGEQLIPFVLCPQCGPGLVSGKVWRAAQDAAGGAGNE